MRAFDRDLIRGGHYGQRSCEPHAKAEHMAAPTNAAFVKKALANSEPSTHGPKRRFAAVQRYVRSREQSRHTKSTAQPTRMTPEWTFPHSTSMLRFVGCPDQRPPSIHLGLVMSCKCLRIHLRRR